MNAGFLDGELSINDELNSSWRFQRLICEHQKYNMFYLQLSLCPIQHPLDRMGNLLSDASGLRQPSR